MVGSEYIGKIERGIMISEKYKSCKTFNPSDYGIKVGNILKKPYTHEETPTTISKMLTMNKHVRTLKPDNKHPIQCFANHCDKRSLWGGGGS